MTADLGALQPAIDGDVVLPGSPEYESVRQPVDIPSTCGRRLSSAARPCRRRRDPRRRGQAGHGDGKNWSGGHLGRGPVLDRGGRLGRHAHGLGGGRGEVATVGAGVRLGDLYDALATHGLTIPAGCGPSVGIAGLTLGGGWGSSAAHMA